MKLTFLHAKNFLSFKDMCLPLEDFKDQIIIVGPNNAGKSNLIRALKFARDVCQDPFNKDEAGAFTHKYGGKKNFELEIGFRLDEEKTKDLNSITEIYVSTYLKGVEIEDSDLSNLFTQKNETYNQETVDKVYLSQVFKKASQELMLLISKLTIHSCSIVIRYNGDPTGFPQGHHIKITCDCDINKYEYELKDDSLHRSNMHSKLRYDLKGWFLEFLKSHDNIVRACKEKGKEIKPEEWLKFILEKGGLSLGNLSVHQIEREHKSKMIELLNKYDYPSADSQNINLFLFIERMFTSHIVILDEVRARPTQCFEDEEFKKKTMDCLSRIYYGTGENLAIFLLKLKNSKVKAERDNYQKIRKWFNEFTEGLEFEISHEQENEGKQHRLNIWIIDKEYQMSINYVGSGLIEALNIFAVLAGNEHCLIALDEPALHLHPIKQHKLMKMLGEVIKTTDNQSIIITHSPHIIDADSLKNIIRFNLEDNETKFYSLKLFRQNEEYTKKLFRQNEEYKYILFARGVIITEGDCEKIGIRMLLEKKSFDLEKYNIAFLNARGDKGFESPIKVAKAFNIPYVVVCDSKATKNISNVEEERNVFAFVEEDFLDFLKKELPAACQRIGKIKNNGREKVKNTISIIEEATENEVKQLKKLEELERFLKEKFDI